VVGSQSQVVDLELIAFAQRYVTSCVKRDIIATFAKSPWGQDTAENIARRLGRSLGVTRVELGDLVLLGLLDQVKADGITLYTLTHKEELRQAALRFSAQLTDKSRHA